jgi:hypothetical protein
MRERGNERERETRIQNALSRSEGVETRLVTKRKRAAGPPPRRRLLLLRHGERLFSPKTLAYRALNERAWEADITRPLSSSFIIVVDLKYTAPRRGVRV